MFKLLKGYVIYAAGFGAGQLVLALHLRPMPTLDQVPSSLWAVIGLGVLANLAALFMALTHVGQDE